MFGEERLLKNTHSGIIASTTAVLLADQPVRLGFIEKIYGKVFLGPVEFDATAGAAYDVVAGDGLPAKPANIVDEVSRIWAPYEGAECFVVKFEREADGSRVEMPLKEWGFSHILS